MQRYYIFLNLQIFYHFFLRKIAKKFILYSPKLCLQLANRYVLASYEHNRYLPSISRNIQYLFHITFILLLGILSVVLLFEEGEVHTAIASCLPEVGMLRKLLILGVLKN